MSVSYTATDGTIGYNILLVDSQGQVVEDINVPPGTTTYDFTNLQPNTQYMTVVTSFDAAQNPFPVGSVTESTAATGNG